MSKMSHLLPCKTCSFLRNGVGRIVKASGQLPHRLEHGIPNSAYHNTASRRITSFWRGNNFGSWNKLGTSNRHRATLNYTKSGSVIPGRTKAARDCTTTSNNSSDASKTSINRLFKPLEYKTSTTAVDQEVNLEFGCDLKTPQNKEKLLKLMSDFYQDSTIRSLCAENNIDGYLFQQTYISFRKYLVNSNGGLETDLHILASDLIRGAGHVTDLVPYFLRHANQIFPMLTCMGDLKQISNLTNPANWYSQARQMRRKFIFHAGPTNSGKTFHALESFKKASRGVYCGPLRLLAQEVSQKTNLSGVPCDLITGEERRYANTDGSPSAHLACTVEMASVSEQYDVAVLDEIQVIKDRQRGWAWTRALLGVCAKEIHLCGEEAALELVTDIVLTTGEDIEVRRYQRLTPLTILDKSLDTLDNIRPGDCIVCFNKATLYHLSLQIHQRGLECAVIYGGLPAETKLKQAKRFNDPDNPCKVVVATDAIGMGINLSIKRMIFAAMERPTLMEGGKTRLELLSTSQALQIAGRAGRYGSQFQDGQVTSLLAKDLPVLKQVLAQPVEKIEKAGLHPTPEQIELFAYHLPGMTISALMEIFIHLSQVDQLYTVCNMDNFLALANEIEHLPLDLRTKFVFCCAPVNIKDPLVKAMFIKYARQFSQNSPLTYDWLAREIQWPLDPPADIRTLQKLEGVHDGIDLYLWLSYRFMDMFLEVELVQQMQGQLDELISTSVHNITSLLRTTQPSPSYKTQQQPPPPPLSNGTDTDLDEDVQSENTEGKLAGKLVKSGLLTQEMLEILKREWEAAKK